MLLSDKTITAVRSLTHEDHATNIPPNVLSINWNVGKRCNYDCSYCSHITHDSVSPFINQSDALTAIDRLYLQMQSTGKIIDWGFTGGEPFMDPSFIMMLEKINSYQTVKSISVSTNGSLPLSTYVSAAKYVSNLTITIHPERSHAETARTISTIKEINKIPGMMLSVTVMLFAGGVKTAKSIIEDLALSGVRTILRKIRPPQTTHPFVYFSPNKKDRELVDLTEQVNIRVASKVVHDQRTTTEENSYYTADELEFLESYYSKEASWNNMGVWYDGGYAEINSDELLASNKHTFNQWICFAGVDSLYIDFDGSVYRGNCYVDGAIGHIKDTVAFVKHPTKCKLNWCTCNADMTVRKASKTIYLKLVT
jgi:MoaA/NifB/PqqE/SkfB family radical SAM enzyme